MAVVSKCGWFLIPFMATAAPAIAGAPKYAITDLGALPQHTSSWAYGLNNDAEVVGDCAPTSGAERMFHWSQGKMTELQAHVNDSGTVDVDDLIMVILNWG